MSDHEIIDRIEKAVLEILGNRCNVNNAAIAEMERRIAEIRLASDTNRCADRNAGRGDGLQEAIGILNVVGVVSAYTGPKQTAC